MLSGMRVSSKEASAALSDVRVSRSGWESADHSRGSGISESAVVGIELSAGWGWYQKVFNLVYQVSESAVVGIEL